MLTSRDEPDAAQRQCARTGDACQVQTQARTSVQPAHVHTCTCTHATSTYPKVANKTYPHKQAGTSERAGGASQPLDPPREPDTAHQ
jgi:hypothetical protein